MIPLLLSEVDVSFSAAAAPSGEPQKSKIQLKNWGGELEGDTDTFGEILERGS